jgi:hypothetical protein
MTRSVALAQRIRQTLARRSGCREKKRFLDGFLLHGNHCLGVWECSLIVRLGPEQAAEALLQPSVQEVRIRGRSMKGWLLVKAEGD